MFFRNVTTILLSILVLTVLAGCKTTRLPGDITSQTLKNQGLVIGSMSRGFGTQQYDNYLFKFREMENDIEKKIVMGRSYPLGPFNDDFEKGMLFAIPLPAGEYEFYDFNTMHTDGLTLVQWGPEEDFSAPFKVKEGKISYIGEINLGAKDRKTLIYYIESSIGTKTAGEPILAIVDARNRDIPLLKEKYTALDWKNLEYKVLGTR